ncbi:hypothetical protein T492DRAFT_857428 [Pavlovales sp. CCMP2436]|nr:hypothetical protein T492DRAFT_857428 [Pavlovales sp. CCMP2436]
MTLSVIFWLAPLVAYLQFAIAYLVINREYSLYAEDRLAYLSDTTSQRHH